MPVLIECYKTSFTVLVTDKDKYDPLLYFAIHTLYLITVLGVFQKLWQSNNSARMYVGEEKMDRTNYRLLYNIAYRIDWSLFLSFQNNWCLYGVWSPLTPSVLNLIICQQTLQSFKITIHRYSAVCGHYVLQKIVCNYFHYRVLFAYSHHQIKGFTEPKDGLA